MYSAIPLLAWSRVTKRGYKSFVARDDSDDQLRGGAGRNRQANWKGKPRSNDTYASTTDPDARLYKKSEKMPTVLCHPGQVLMENRSGLVVVGAAVSHADGMNERVNAVRLLDSLPGRDANRGRRQGSRYA